MGHIIQSKIDIRRWKPIHLSRTGPAILRLFFEDDLVIFCKVELNQARLKNILNQFCEISGHRISTRKNNIYFSKGVKDDTRNQITQMFSFQDVQNFGTYLGIPIFHDKVTNSTLSFVVAKVRRKLQN